MSQHPPAPDGSPDPNPSEPEAPIRAGDIFKKVPRETKAEPDRKTPSRKPRRFGTRPETLDPAWRSDNPLPLAKPRPKDRKAPPPKPPVDLTAPRRRLPAAKRRELILDAAIDAFADTGYHQTSLEEVGRRAGVSKALIYEHFVSKQELYEELLETYVRELLERVATAAISVEEGGETRLLAGLEGFLEFVDERRDAWRMLIRNRASDDVAELFERLYSEVGATIGSLLAEEMPPSVLPEGADFDMVVEATSRQLLGAITAMANWWDEHRDVPRTQVLAMIMEFAWVGLERAAGGERWTEPSMRKAGPGNA